MSKPIMDLDDELHAAYAEMEELRGRIIDLRELLRLSHGERPHPDTCLCQACCAWATVERELKRP